ncbi:MAG: 23S rRNA (adenine(2503)-C(2))-methyltransferase RlmN [Candidatus Nanopelagicales bacterium]|nr:23S rRNA (adenine(2503)-C(2))-methyltransferase RlmN [Candidatus Nanopelagicales bacterium]MDZ4250730.1 23S rRNA (adenine(2503)-C(2))-methyltransferase RlmN [Candidatus Nanopelagicales bacterium]
MKPPVHWADMTPEERVLAVTAAGLAKFRADQVSRHYFSGLSADPGSWTDLSSAVAGTVAKEWFPNLLETDRQVACDGGDTRKFSWRIAGDARIESVVMAYPDRVTVCVSSQAGCGIGCPFCATGQGGLVRNLSTGEIVEQVRLAAVEAANWSPTRPLRLGNVVFMGMGEPLANYRAVVAALRCIISPAPSGFGISARSVTVSTAGLVPRILDLATEGLPVTLAVSLHAPDDDLRDSLVPVNKRWPVAEVMRAADEYADRTGRRYSVEYALIGDVNDQLWRADALASLVKGRLAHVNVIPLSPTSGSGWTASDASAGSEFVSRLRGRGVQVSVRASRGGEIGGACGQLGGS